MNKFQRWKNIQKCYPFEEKRLLTWEPPYIVQPKYDGVRCRAVPIENGYLLLSSEEHIIYSVPHINEALEKDKSLGIELDGELYAHGLGFEEIVSRTSRTVNLHSGYKDIKFHIFDYVSQESQAIRIKSLSDLDLKDPLIKSPYWLAWDLEWVMRIYDNLISLGYEGIIVRHYAGPYERKRSTLVMKFKPKKEDEYEIVGVVEEMSIHGSPKGRLGALILDSGDGHTFNVGTGFSEDDRIRLWKEELVGRVCKIQYQHLTAGKKVPRFPVFVDILDKKEK